MRVWRRQPAKGQNRSQLVQVHDIGEIDPNLPVVFVFPGANVGNISRYAPTPQKTHARRRQSDKRQASAQAKHIANTLGINESTPDVQVLVVTYDSYFELARGVWAEFRRGQSRDPESEQLVRQFIRPLQERAAKTGQAAPTTFFGTSYGSIFAQNVRNSLVRSYRRDGVPFPKIRERLADIFLVTVADISLAAAMPGKRALHNIQFSGMAFSFHNDRTGMLAHSSYNKIPKSYQRFGEIEIGWDGRGFCRIFSPAPRYITTQKDDKKKRIEDFHLGNFYLNHKPALVYFDEAPNGIGELFRETLNNAARRSERLNARQLLPESLRPLKAVTDSSRYFHTHGKRPISHVARLKEQMSQKMGRSA